MEKEMIAYVSKIKFVTVICRLTIEEEFFILGKIPNVNKNESLLLTNRERLITASFAPQLIGNNVLSFNPAYPKTMPDVAEQPIDLMCLDTSKTNFKNLLSKLAIVKYSKPEPVTGPAAIQLLSQILDEDRNIGFFYLYDLMTNSLNISIIPEDKAHGTGSILFRFLPDSYSEIQRVILRVMDGHPSLAEKMPIFEDKRKLKLPSLAGLDVFQSHIKNCAAYIQANLQELKQTRLYVNIPPAYAVVRSVSSDIGIMDPRQLEFRPWVTPRITDYDCCKRTITLSTIPAALRTISARFTDDEVTKLLSAPMECLGLSDFIDNLSLSQRKVSKISGDF
jgi:hypothetical protein